MNDSSTDNEEIIREASRSSERLRTTTICEEFSFFELIAYGEKLRDDQMNFHLLKRKTELKEFVRKMMRNC
jgi:hypothetical protein